MCILCSEICTFPNKISVYYNIVLKNGNYYIIQGDQLSGKPGHVRDFNKSQGSVRDYQGKWIELFTVSFIFASIQVFSSIQLELYVNYSFIIMKSCVIF